MHDFVFCWYFFTMKICIYFTSINIYFSFNVLVSIHCLIIKPFFNKLLTLPYIALYFFSNSISWTKKSINLVLLSKHLVYPFIWGSFMHNGMGKALAWLIQPIKFINEPFLLYKSFLDNTILLISTLSILIDLLLLTLKIFHTLFLCFYC